MKINILAKMKNFFAWNSNKNYIFEIKIEYFQEKHFPLFSFFYEKRNFFQMKIERK